MAKRRTRFITWAKRDPDDERPMKITFKGSDGTQKFKSYDVVSYSMMERIRYAWIESIDLVNDVWNVVIYED